MRPALIPQGVKVEEFVYRSGKTEVVFMAPYPSEGPMLVMDGNGHQVWMFMYAHFVFSWPRGAVRVKVSHGTLAGPRMALYTNVKINAYWSGPALAEFGRAWARDHLARFSNHQ